MKGRDPPLPTGRPRGALALAPMCGWGVPVAPWFDPSHPGDSTGTRTHM